MVAGVSGSHSSLSSSSTSPSSLPPSSTFFPTSAILERTDRRGRRRHVPPREGDLPQIPLANGTEDLPDRRSDISSSNEAPGMSANWSQDSSMPSGERERVDIADIGTGAGVIRQVEKKGSRWGLSSVLNSVPGGFGVVGAVYLGYTASALGRGAAGVAGPSMLLDAALALHRSDIGLIFAAGEFAGLLGKVLTGFVTDALGGRAVFLGSMAVSATACASLPIVATRLVGSAHIAPKYVLAAFWMASKFAQSALWPSMTKLVHENVKECHHGKCWGLLSTASEVGAVAASMGLAALLQRAGWQGVFSGAATVMAVVTTSLLFLLQRTSEQQSVGGAGAASACVKQGDAVGGPAAQHPLADASWREAMRYFSRSSKFWNCLLGVACLQPILELVTIAPLYLVDSHGITPVRAAELVAFIPFAAAIALFSGGFAYDKLTQRQRAASMSALLAAAAALLVSVLALPMLVLRLSLVSLCVSVPYYMPSAVFSTKFGGSKYCGTVSALLDSAGFATSMALLGGCGWLAETRGWSWVMGCMAALTFAGFLFMGRYLWSEVTPDAIAAPESKDKVTCNCAEGANVVGAVAEAVEEEGIVFEGSVAERLTLSDALRKRRRILELNDYETSDLGYTRMEFERLYADNAAAANDAVAS
eukprot:jgi/Chlat1/8735/Chrsp9S00722